MTEEIAGRVPLLKVQIRNDSKSYYPHVLLEGLAEEKRLITAEYIESYRTIAEFQPMLLEANFRWPDVYEVGDETSRTQSLTSLPNSSRLPWGAISSMIGRSRRMLMKLMKSPRLEGSTGLTRGGSHARTRNRLDRMNYTLGALPGGFSWGVGARPGHGGWADFAGAKGHAASRSPILGGTWSVDFERVRAVRLARGGWWRAVTGTRRCV